VVVKPIHAKIAIGTDPALDGREGCIQFLGDLLPGAVSVEIELYGSMSGLDIVASRT